MSLFAVVSNDVVLTIGPFAQVTALADEQRKRGTQVIVRRTKPQDHAVTPADWAVRVFAAGMSDLLHCLDQDDAQATLREVRANGMRAQIVRV